jgi:hypothetical protein
LRVSEVDLPPGRAFSGTIFDNALSVLTCEPVPDAGHVFELLLKCGVCHFSRLLTALGGILLVFQDLLHGSNLPQPARAENIAATIGW